MLKELIVKNIVLIESIKIEFKQGLSVLTGETGTCKSILLDSLGLIIGNRVDFNLIRHGESDASVTAIFQINEKHPVIKVIQKYDIELEDELIIRRQIKADGKSKCLVKNRPGCNATTADLQEVDSNECKKSFIYPVQYSVGCV